MQIAAHSDREDAIAVDDRSGAGGIVRPVARSQGHRVIVFPITPAGLGLQAFDHFPVLTGVNHDEVVTRNNGGSMARSAFDLPHQLRTFGRPGFEELRFLRVQIVPRSQEAGPSRSHRRRRKRFRGGVEGEAIKGLRLCKGQAGGEEEKGGNFHKKGFLRGSLRGSLRATRPHGQNGFRAGALTRFRQGTGGAGKAINPCWTIGEAR